MKQVILVRSDLDMSEGKIAAQVSHASVQCVLKSPKKTIEAWVAEGMKKVILVVHDAEELMLYFKKAKETKLVAVVITDAGRTEIAPGTRTCVGIGPDEDKKVDKVTGKLNVL